MVSSGMLRRVALRNVRRLLVAACVVPSSPILVTLMKEAPGSSETSVLTKATRRNILEDTILHSHRRENLKSYTMCWGPREADSLPGRIKGPNVAHDFQLILSMPSSGMLRRVALVRTDVSKERPFLPELQVSDRGRWHSSLP
jgi:hypothetical protein